MSKKNNLTKKDKKIWSDFTKNLANIEDKDSNFYVKNVNRNEIKKLDLHGYSLLEANQKVKSFINNSFERNYKKLLIVTGKGLRSKAYKDPYRSNNMSILKNSVPDFIRNYQQLCNKITRISVANQKDGGEGAFYIFLKNKF